MTHINETIRIKGYDLKLTCVACPEQYDVFLNGTQVGYLRLRHGRFRADFPDCGGETVYSAYPNGDGIFEDSERDYHLNAAIEAIDVKLKLIQKESEIG